MSVNWMDVSGLDFKVLMLLERVQISWLPGWLPEEDLSVALKANPTVAWYWEHKCPEIKEWIQDVISRAEGENAQQTVREAELSVMEAVNDLLVYALDPDLYDRLPFLDWADRELTDLVDLNQQVVIDVGAGTGRISFLAAREGAAVVFAVEPVENLRRYIKQKSRRAGLKNLFTLDGLITDIPFPDHFADICLGGHVFGDDPEMEFAEMFRVTKPGGLVILLPGNNDQDQGPHDYLVEKGFEWSRFLEPTEGWKRKYWLFKESGSLDNAVPLGTR